MRSPIPPVDHHGRDLRALLCRDIEVVDDLNLTIRDQLHSSVLQSCFSMAVVSTVNEPFPSRHLKCWSAMNAGQPWLQTTEIWQERPSEPLRSDFRPELTHLRKNRGIAVHTTREFLTDGSRISHSYCNV